MGALDRLSWPLVTERLVLRPAVAADAAEMWRYRRLPEVSRWLTAANATYDEFRDHFVDPDRLAQTLIIQVGETAIGDLMLRVEDAWAQAEVAEQARGVQAELGWCLDPRFGGQGFATEAVAALIRLCFDELRLRRVIASCFSDNVPSWRLMERLGMRREAHTVRDALHRCGDWLDGYTYALLADESPSGH